MKKLCIFICLILMLGMLSGCKDQVKPEPTPDVSESQAPTAAPDTGDSEDKEKPEELPSTLPEPEKTKSILDNKILLDRNGVLWQIPNAIIESGVQQNMLIYGEDLLLWGSRPGDDMKPRLAMYIISTETGEAEYEASFEDIDLAGVQICADKIVLTDWADGQVILLDEKLGLIESLEVDSQYNGIYVDSAAENIFVFTSDSGIRVIPIDGGQERVLLENTTGLYPSSSNGSRVNVAYTDIATQLAQSAVVDLDSCEVYPVPFEGAFSNCRMVSDTWLAAVFGKNGEYLVGRAERPGVLSLGSGSTASFLDDRAGIRVSTYYEGAFTVSIYEADGRFISRCTLPEGSSSMYYEPLWSEKDGGYYFTVTTPEGKDELFFWNISAPTVGRSLEIEPLSEQSVQGTAAEAALYERAANIGERFGIDILIADQCAVDLAEYTMSQECSSVIIGQALDAVEEVLAVYPEGFIPQLRYGIVKRIELQLTGRIEKKELPENISGFSSFSGFMTERDGAAIIVADISTAGSVEQLIHHELAHIIDSKLTFDARLRDDALYSEAGWQSLLPQGFVYANTYDAIPMEYFTDGYESWFIDLYSRTFAREDVARTLEYAMVGSAWTFSSSEGRLAKLDYLCKCIRDAFDDTGWPETTVWEKTLHSAK